MMPTLKRTPDKMCWLQAASWPFPLRLTRILSCPSESSGEPTQRCAGALGLPEQSQPVWEEKRSKNGSATTMRDTTLSPLCYVTNVWSVITCSFQHSAPLSVRPELQQTNGCFHLGIFQSCTSISPSTPLSAPSPGLLDNFCLWS